MIGSFNYFAFYFSILLYFRYVSEWHLIQINCVNLQHNNLCILTGAFRPFMSNVITNVFRLKSTMLFCAFSLIYHIYVLFFFFFPHLSWCSLDLFFSLLPIYFLSVSLWILCFFPILLVVTLEVTAFTLHVSKSNVN